MPIYEYRCESCGAEFEELQKVGAAPPACTSCGAEEGVARRVSRTSFVLKGGGWYKDGYTGPSNSGGSSSSSSSSDSGSSSSSSSTSSD